MCMYFCVCIGLQLQKIKKKTEISYKLYTTTDVQNPKKHVDSYHLITRETKARPPDITAQNTKLVFDIKLIYL